MEYSPPREEGWLRHQENAGEAHLSAADGVVAHKSSSGVSDDFLDGCALAGLRGLRPPSAPTLSLWFLFCLLFGVPRILGVVL